MTTPWSKPDALALIEKYGPVEWEGCCASNPSFRLGYHIECRTASRRWFKHALMKRAGWLPLDALSDHEAEVLLNDWAEKWLAKHGWSTHTWPDMYIVDSEDKDRISQGDTKAAALIAAMKEIGK